MSKPSSSPKIDATMIATFGYGSLVNKHTLRTPYVSMHRVRVAGWRRVWLRRPKIAGSFAPIDDLAFLSVERDTGSYIDGMVVVDHASSLAALDEREKLYDRVGLTTDLVTFPDNDRPSGLENIYVYQASACDDGDQPPRILRSYLDAVAQGYLQTYGPTGLDGFKSTTRGWECPIFEDRADPLYPRPVILSKTERIQIDAVFPAYAS